MKFEIKLESLHGTSTRTVELERIGEEQRIRVDGRLLDADAVQVGANTISILLDGQSFEIHVAPGPPGRLTLQAGPQEFRAEVQDPRAWRGRKHGALEAEGRQPVLAPMPGKVIRVLAAAGDQVQAGSGLLVMEAMKMQNEIRSPKSGKLDRLLVKEGQNVSAGEVLAWVE